VKSCSLTSSASPKVGEIEADPRVLVTFQNGAQFVCVAGTARVRRDRARLQWSESWRIWYPAGVDDPCLCLLAVQPSAGEYWDHAGIKGFKYIGKAPPPTSAATASPTMRPCTRQG